MPRVKYTGDMIKKLRMLPYAVKEKTYKHARYATLMANEAFCFMEWMLPHCDILPIVDTCADEISILYLNVLHSTALHLKLKISFYSTTIYKKITRTSASNTVYGSIVDSQKYTISLEHWKKYQHVFTVMKQNFNFALFSQILYQQHNIIYNLISMSRTLPSLLALGNREVLELVLHYLDADKPRTGKQVLEINHKFAKHIRSKLPSMPADIRIEILDIPRAH